jgi:putative nucleotidyltransferase with HDIG domain
VTVSAGVATTPEDGVELTELHRRADAALYWCKHHGKDLCAVASEAADDSDRLDEPSSLQHLYGIVEMLDSGDLRTRAHSQTVAAYSVAVGKAMGLEPAQLIKLRRAALLHDVGKVSVPAEILDKPGPLTDAEFAIVRGHSAAGAEMLAHAGLPDEARWVRWHHERVDGMGYPDGLTGAELPLEARIMFVADAFEAMTSDRPYRAGTSADEAIAELQRCVGTQFDAHAVAALVALVRAGEIAVLPNRASMWDDRLDAAPARYTLSRAAGGRSLPVRRSAARTGSPAQARSRATTAAPPERSSRRPPRSRAGRASGPSR